MNGATNGMHRNPADFVFFVVCFLGLVLTAAGIITTVVWAAALGIFLIAVGLAYFALCGFF